ncbi:unnamed protein product, partial [Urochloa humidicola]
AESAAGAAACLSVRVSAVLAGGSSFSHLLLCLTLTRLQIRHCSGLRRRRSATGPATAAQVRGRVGIRCGRGGRQPGLAEVGRSCHFRSHENRAWHVRALPRPAWLASSCPGAA